MANNTPMWWMCGNSSHPHRKTEPPCPSPDSPPAQATPPSPQEAAFQGAISAISERFRHMDSETLLLLALLWLLHQEHADRKLLLALAYIIW